MNGDSSGNCPTGQPCGSSALYCETYSPPSTTGATAISSLPTGYGGAHIISAPGNYYLSSNLTADESAIAITYTGGSAIDINLSGYTLTYGNTGDGTGSSQIGEYGVLMCNTGNISSEGMDSSYGSNGLCASGGLSAKNVTIENGNIVQSPNASGYTVPNLCPGSGVSCSTAVDWPSTYSNAIMSQYNSGLTVRHVTITVQNVGSKPIMIQNMQPGSGMDIECNTINDKVTVLNERAAVHAAIWTGNLSANTSASMIQYNTIVGSPQNGIVVGVGAYDPHPTAVQYNDIDVGYYQTTPYLSQTQAYANDYALGAAAYGGLFQYNYIHNTFGRGIGVIFGNDQGGSTISHNYVTTQDYSAYGEYGTNGTIPGASWVGGCQIGGARGFETKDSPAINVLNNMFIIGVNQCGGSGVELAELPCQSISCSAPASYPIAINNNTIQINNLSGSSSPGTNMGISCIDLQEVQGNYSNYFSPMTGNSCTSDGNFVFSEGYEPGDYFTFSSSTYSLGSHPLSSGCGGSSSSPCGYMMLWEGQQAPPSDELGYVFLDTSLSNAASLNFSGSSSAPLARSATVKWTYTVTVQNSSSSASIDGATVSVLDAGGNNTSCTTNTTGSCSLILNQEVVSSLAGNGNLTTESLNPNAMTISATGCTTLTFNLAVTNTIHETRTLSCP